VGDSVVDLECGRNARIKRVLVRTGRGEMTLREVDAGRVPAPDHVAADLNEAAVWIAARVQQSEPRARAGNI
jgi:D-glycero-D-manno-heptose 1,7-bisphosphate phosphatase